MIREANNSDISFITKRLNYFNVKGSSDILNHPFNNYLICEDAGLDIGFIEYALYYDRIEVNYIFVDEKYRRRGYASKMLDFLISNNNVDNITLEVACNNQSAIDLYKKFDFKEVTIRKNYYDGIDAIMMIRRF